MSLRARLRALEERRRDGCPACAGRQVWRTEYPEGFHFGEPPPPPRPPEEYICQRCGRDCSAVIRVFYDPVPEPDS